MLADNYEVEIAGYSHNGSLWHPLQGVSGYKVTPVGRPGWNPVFSLWPLMRFLRTNDADILYVLKPRFHNLLAGLLAKKKRLLVLDIDDWETELAKMTGSPYRLVNRLIGWGLYFPLLAEKLVWLADKITVSNEFLRAKFGGIVIPHARPSSFAHREIPSKVAIREKYRLPLQVPLVMFHGTLQPHKGLDVLVEAMILCAHPSLHMVIAGVSKADIGKGRIAGLRERLPPDRYSLIASVPWNDRDALLKAADMLVIPQKHNAFTCHGQSPAKLMDAMASGVPVIASDVSDMARLLSGAGWIVPPDDPQALAGAMEAILARPQEAKTRAARAQALFLERYSYDVVSASLRAVMG